MNMPLHVASREPSPENYEMPVKFIGDSYDFPCANQVENYGGDINVYVVWDHHLIYCAPNAYRLPPDMKLRDFLEQVFAPDYPQHPRH